MRWSKVRKLVEDSFAESVRGRVTVHQTRYASSKSTGRAWIAIDGSEVANFSANECDNREMYAYNHWRDGKFQPPVINDRDPDALVEKGEFSNYDFTWACWDYLNQPIEASPSHANPQQQSLAVLSARTGKRRLRRLAEANDLHPLTRALLEFRMQCEGMLSATPSRR